MRTRLYQGLALLSLLNPLAAFAAGLPEPLTLEACLAVADRQAPMLAAAEARVAESQAEQALARSALLPALRLKGQLAYIKPTAPSVTETGDWTDDNRAGLVLRQPLIDFGRRDSLLAAARARRSASEMALTDLRNQQRIEVMARYFEVLLADRRNEVANEAMAVAFVRFRDGGDRKELGDISELELAQLEDTFRALRSRYIETQQAQRESRLRLATALGIEDAIPSELVSPTQLPASASTEDFEALFKTALAGNPALKALNDSLKARENEFQASRRNFLPSIDAEAQTNYYSRELAIRERWMIGLKLDWPLYEGGAQGAARSQALARLNEGRAEMADRRLRLREALMDVLSNMETLRERQKAAEARVKYRNKALDLGRSLYELELKSDLGNAMVDFTDAELFQAEVRYAQALNAARLQALLGQTVQLPAPAKETSHAQGS